MKVKLELSTACAPQSFSANLDAQHPWAFLGLVRAMLGSAVQVALDSVKMLYFANGGMLLGRHDAQSKLGDLVYIYARVSLNLAHSRLYLTSCL